jgi:hypothetical protein
MKYLLAAVCAVGLFAMPEQASAQREGGAFFGPFSHGDSSGASFAGWPPKLPKTAAPVTVKRMAKKPKRK